MRTMLSGTPNKRRISVPKIRKKRDQEQRIEAGFPSHLAMRGGVLAFQHLEIDRQDLNGFIIASNVANVPTNSESS